jgi:secreted Zn-dependent insulinase-like peptidase
MTLTDITTLTVDASLTVKGDANVDEVVQVVHQRLSEQPGFQQLHYGEWSEDPNTLTLAFCVSLNYLMTQRRETN